MKNSILAAGAAAVLVSLSAPSALGQSGTPTPPMEEQPLQENQTVPQQNEAAESDLTEQDRTFAEQAAADNEAELKFATLGAQKAQMDEVKEYATMLVEDHTKAGDELRQIAQEAGLTLNTEVSQDVLAAHERMGTLSGGEFDYAFVERMVADHEKAVALYEKQAGEGQHDALKQFAASKVDALRTHLDRARQLERQMGEQPVAGTPGGTPSASQQESMAGAQEPPPAAEPQNPLTAMPVGDLIGKTVMNPQGEELGEIEDIVVGGSDQSVRAIISVGGFLGIGAKSVALSFEELEPGQDAESVLLTSGETIEQLKQRPAFDGASGDYRSAPPEQTPAESQL